VIVRSPSPFPDQHPKVARYPLSAILTVAAECRRSLNATRKSVVASPFRGTPSRRTEHSVEFGIDEFVTVAGGRFEAFAIEHGDHAPPVPNQSAFLERSCDLRDGRASHAQHESQIILRQLKLVAVDPIVRLEEPPRATRFRRMMRVAGRALRNLRNQRLRITQQDPQ